MVQNGNFLPIKNGSYTQNDGHDRSSLRPCTVPAYMALSIHFLPPSDTYFAADGSAIISQVETQMTDGTTRVCDSISPETAQLLSQLTPKMFTHQNITQVCSLYILFFIIQLAKDIKMKTIQKMRSDELPRSTKEHYHQKVQCSH